MGVFKKLGRQVEQFKSKAETAAENHSAYQCKECGERFRKYHEQCPECESRETISSKPQ